MNRDQLDYIIAENGETMNKSRRSEKTCGHSGSKERLPAKINDDDNTFFVITFFLFGPKIL